MIGIVYHCYLVNNWKSLVKEQLSRLKTSGLYDACDLLYITVNLAGVDESLFTEEIKEYKKAIVDTYKDNAAEYPGIKKVKDLSNKYEDIKILYFHTKGVNNNYVDLNTNEISYEKVNNIKAWRDCLEYFLIDRWEENIDKLNYYDTTGVTCNSGWYWGNFWWANSSHISKTEDVGFWGRWDYEAWLNKGVEAPKNYEWHHFTYNPYLTYMDPSWYKGDSPYKGQKIIIQKAYYGSPPFVIDEGYSGIELNVGADVIEQVNNLLSVEDYKKFNFNINNTTMGGDPCFGYRKFLIVEFYPEKDSNKIYKIASHEGHTLTFEF
jgi:hypothetical protein